MKPPSGNTLLVTGVSGDLGGRLQGAGFQIIEAVSLGEARRVLRTTQTDLVLLHDPGPPNALLDACRELRRASPVPIVLLTPVDSELDATVGLELGADDYITTPVELRELCARLQAVVRRARADEIRRAKGRLLRVGDVLLSLDNRTAEVGGHRVQLAPKEFTLLYLLMTHAGRVLSRAWLRERVCAGASEGKADMVLNSDVRRLRERLEEAGASRSRITTIRGLGYRYDGRL